nr:MAG TPA: hypothetical protein [Caudoviricetes sp.]
MSPCFIYRSAKMSLLQILKSAKMTLKPLAI